VEPPSVADDESPGKRALVYPIDISFSVLGSPLETVPSVDEDNDDSGGPQEAPAGPLGVSPPLPFSKRQGRGTTELGPAVANGTGGQLLSVWALRPLPVAMSCEIRGAFMAHTSSQERAEMECISQSTMHAGNGP
jgi:hypothetical protein